MNNQCSICKCEKVPINISKIKEIKLKQIISKITKKDPDTSTLINKCNCKNNNQKVHKICLILNIVFNFDLNCKECNADYNISISKNINTLKRLCKLCSFISLSLFHICIYAGAVFLVLYLHLINKDLKNNFEENKFYHIYYFFAGGIFIINTLILIVTFYYFVDKNNKDIFSYNIDVKDISEQNKNKKNIDGYYNLLYKYYRFFYNTQIRYLIEKKQKNVLASRGYGSFNKDLMDIIIKNNKECRQENIFNNGGEDILNLNKKSIEKEKIKNEGEDKIIKTNNNIPEQSNGIINNMFESFKKSSPQKEEEEKNNDNNSNKDKLLSLSEKKSENTNPINLETSKGNKNNIIINEELQEKNININNELIEREKEEKKEENKKENEFDNNIEKENKINNEKINKKRDINMSFNSEKIQNKKVKKIAKTYFYKKTNNNNILGKAKTLIDPKKPRKKNKKKEKQQEKNNKLIIHDEDKKYVDSTFLVKSEKEEKYKKEEKNTHGNNLIEDDPFNMIISIPLHNNGK